MKHITDTTKFTYASALQGLAVPAALMKAGLDSAGSIAKIACILGMSVGTLLASTEAHAAVNYQLEVENYYGESIRIDQVRYRHNNTWWETVLAAGDGRTFGPGDCTAYTDSGGSNREYCDESDNRGLYMHWSVSNLLGECGDDIDWEVKFTVDGRTITVQNATPASRYGTGSNCLDHFLVDQYGRVWLGGEVVNTDVMEMYIINWKGNDAQGTKLAQMNMAAETTTVGSIYGDHNCATDIDFHPISGTLYGISCQGYGAGSYLYTLDTASAHADRIGQLGNNMQATSIAFHPDTDELYAIDNAGNGWGTVLFKIDTTTAAVTTIGTLAGDRTHATSIAFDSSGTLYAINNAYTGGSGTVLYTINTSTAQTTNVATLNGDRTQATSIRFTASDKLLGINYNDGGGAGKMLFAIDTANASTTDINWLSGNHSYATALAIK